MLGPIAHSQSIAIAVLLRPSLLLCPSRTGANNRPCALTVAGAGLLLTLLVYLKRHRDRGLQRELAADRAHQQEQNYFGPSTAEAGRLPLTHMGMPVTGTGPGSRTGRSLAPVNRLPQQAEEGAEELPTYGVALAAKAVEVEGVAYPPAAYAPRGNGSAEPPPYAVQAQARQGEPSHPRRASGA
ncbi:hypothetical protein CALCODRAFT_498976 [Calocera cornea HHB12733]|uniref:Transmembrane protein n=1 Tax=Calocera cornea HHB12733 TaxID=1353952 RepID=A0A165EMG7_9BASI|nr:hypothetical protein CALCODRAFT_498976 [Calocera cornea HHB12733]